MHPEKVLIDAAAGATGDSSDVALRLVVAVGSLADGANAHTAGKRAVCSSVVGTSGRDARMSAHAAAADAGAEGVAFADARTPM